MDKYYVIKKQSKKEDRRTIYHLIRDGLFLAVMFYGGMLLFFEFMIFLNSL